MNRAELLEQIRTGRQQLEGTLARGSDDQMLLPALPGNWSVKDLLAHFGWWEQRIADLYHTLQQGAVPDPASNELLVDELNARVFAEYHDQTLPQIRRMESAAFQSILSLAETAPEDDLFNSSRFAWTAGRPFAEWISDNTYGHYEEHSNDLQAWLK